MMQGTLKCGLSGVVVLPPDGRQVGWKARAGTPPEQLPGRVESSSPLMATRRSPGGARGFADRPF